MSNSRLIAMLRSRALELKAWRIGGYDLPNGLASSLLDAEHRLSEAAAALEEKDEATDGR